MNNLLEGKLIDYALDRQAVKIQRGAVEQLENELHETDLWKEIQAEKEILTGAIEKDIEKKGEIREVALLIYAREGNKTICDAVKVGEYTVVDIHDSGLALDWAIKHGMALQLDNKQIKALAKTDLKIDGVSVTKLPRVKIAADLSAYLDPEQG